jgi:hypothetical protein
MRRMISLFVATLILLAVPVNASGWREWAEEVQISQEFLSTPLGQVLFDFVKGLAADVVLDFATVFIGGFFVHP